MGAQGFQTDDTFIPTFQFSLLTSYIDYPDEIIEPGRTWDSSPDKQSHERTFDSLDLLKKAPTYWVLLLRALCTQNQLGISQMIWTVALITLRKSRGWKFVGKSPARTEGAMSKKAQVQTIIERGWNNLALWLSKSGINQNTLFNLLFFLNKKKIQIYSSPQVQLERDTIL